MHQPTDFSSRPQCARSEVIDILADSLYDAITGARLEVGCPVPTGHSAAPSEEGPQPCDAETPDSTDCVGG